MVFLEKIETWSAEFSGLIFFFNWRCCKLCTITFLKQNIAAFFFRLGITLTNLLYHLSCLVLLFLVVSSIKHILKK